MKVRGYAIGGSHCVMEADGSWGEILECLNSNRVLFKILKGYCSRQVGFCKVFCNQNVIDFNWLC